MLTDNTNLFFTQVRYYEAVGIGEDLMDYKLRTLLKSTRTKSNQKFNCLNFHSYTVYLDNIKFFICPTDA